MGQQIVMAATGGKGMKKRGRLHDVRIYHIVFCIGLFFLSLCPGTTVFGESARPCSDEIAKFCKDVRPGGGHLLTCLEQHENDLSATCRKKIEEVKQRLREAQEACGKDIEKFCKDVKPGAGRIAKCLRGVESELSPACRQKVRRPSRKRPKGKDSAQ
jgi:hypothetical protein